MNNLIFENQHVRDFQRVSQHKPCPICKHPNWCGVSSNGSVCVCMRISEGSISVTRNHGFLHCLNEQPYRRQTQRIFSIPVEKKSHQKFDKLAAEFSSDVKAKYLCSFANHLGVSEKSLTRLEIGWSKQNWAWSFPMKQEDGIINGIRLRNWMGQKWCVPGSRDGLFLLDLSLEEILFIAEGPTDTAALLDFGFNAIGRPSALGGEKILVKLIRAIKPNKVVVIADRDDNGVGQRGAQNLACRLALYVHEIKVIAPPPGIKDARQWKQQGAVRENILQAIDRAKKVEVHVERNSR